MKTDEGEVKLRREQGALPSEGTCPDKVDRDWDR